ncbi:hypothetical protein BKA64DRAFT_704782 [Cadophora sp. MPI-SDFR-AT-0126]|nr:hypothetical protein BKA64DRAFT_704782 [Leotiomycetes sp. MPI-SDFR-AT-0126]
MLKRGHRILGSGPVTSWLCGTRGGEKQEGTDGSELPSRNLEPGDFARLRDLDFETRLRRLYSESIVSIYRSTSTAEINLSYLSRIRLHRLRQTLLKEALEINYVPHKAGDESPETSSKVSDIHHYVQALKDHEYIIACALKGKDQDPFVLSTAKPYDQMLIRECGKGLVDELRASPGFNETHPNYESYMQIQSDLRLSESPPPPPLEAQDWDLFGGSRNRRNKRVASIQFLKRVGMAFIGGAFLIGPMHILVLHPGKISNLVTASVFVVLFGILVAAVLERIFDVLSVTAAYAAVLVVFVGTSTGAASAGH